ncbi:MAG: AAA family ATPase [Acidimicrobiales bacterium]
MTSQRATVTRGFDLTECFEGIVDNIELVIQGKDDVIRLALVCLVSEGHLLIEDVPGVGKTSLAKALAMSLACEWQRIQFTPDLLPSDVTGVSVYSRSQETFQFRPGGVFANVVLGDEINRASPKTQSALLEAMEEGQVTVDTTTYRLPRPFMVIATQNPVEHEGTYPLPESQLDRFLMRVRVGYPSRSAEMAMLETHASARIIDGLGAVAGPEDVAGMVAVAAQVYVAPALKGYMVDLAGVTRNHPDLALGMSPRSALALLRASRTWAAVQARDYVIPDDVKAMAKPVLSHRLMLSPEAQLGAGDVADVLDDVLARLPVPTARSVQT